MTENIILHVVRFRPTFKTTTPTSRTQLKLQLQREQQQQELERKSNSKRSTECITSLQSPACTQNNSLDSNGCYTKSEAISNSVHSSLSSQYSIQDYIKPTESVQKVALQSILPSDVLQVSIFFMFCFLNIVIFFFWVKSVKWLREVRTRRSMYK